MIGLEEWDNWLDINDELEPLDSATFSSGDKETKFIDLAADVFSGISTNNGNESVETTVINCHQAPRVTFDMPTQSGKQTCELADILFELRIIDNGNVSDRRAILSQAKMGDDNQDRWDIDITQHYLLTFLPPFEGSTLGDSSGYQVANVNYNLTNYSLASKLTHPTFTTPFDLARGLANWDYGQSSPFTYRHRNIGKYPRIKGTIGFVASFLNGYRGSEIRMGTEAESLIDELIDYAKRNGRVVTDGGVGLPGTNETESPGFTAIRIEINREGYE